MAGMKGVSDDDIARWMCESLVMKVVMKKLFLCAVILVPVNQNLVMEKKVTIIRNL
jgi:hypothetical protein